jgi:hypothetical protein
MKKLLRKLVEWCVGFVVSAMLTAYKALKLPLWIKATATFGLVTLVATIFKILNVLVIQRGVVIAVLTLVIMQK